MITTASNGQVWTYSPYMRLVGGTLAGINISQQIWMYNSSSTYLAGLTTSTIIPGGNNLASQKLSGSVTLNQATVAFILPVTLFSIPVSGTAFNFTLRVGAPQLELGAFATSLILPPIGTPAASTRLRDQIITPINGLTNNLTLDAEAIVGNASPTTYSRIAQLDDGTNTNSLIILTTPTSNPPVNIYAQGGSNNIYDPVSDKNYLINTLRKASVSISSTQLIFSHNSVTAIANNTPGIQPLYNTLRIGCDSGGSSQWGGYICRIRIWNRNQQIAEITQVTT